MLTFYHSILQLSRNVSQREKSWEAVCVSSCTLQIIGPKGDRSIMIWALALRNPFTFAVQSGTGDIFINDVGQNT